MSISINTFTNENFTVNIINKLATLAVLAIFISLFITAKINANEYIGSKQCQSCHQKEYSDWQGSHHDMSMQHASDSAILGNFDNYNLEFNGKTNRFFKKGDEFWVNIEGPDGKFHDYQIKYTFGYTPLQQYMVEFEDGRVQLIPFAWDAQTKEAGGQRWFHLYPEFTENHDTFYWMNTGQNWNYMCADCHSTNVQKNYDVETNSYQTNFSEINVGCEACHGPASEHIQWTTNKSDQTTENQSVGFSRDITKQVTSWVSRKGLNTLKPDHATDNTRSQQTLVCAQCHSRRTQISNNDHVTGNEFGERYLLNLIDGVNYYPDGQVYNEDFVYGSFLQSKMHENGVTCSNCHNPHSAELILPKETLCLQCHQADTYANKTHHQHQNDSTGAQCVNCHMPETTYMELDARRDHGFHVPRPDLAKTLGSPDTCLSCHEDKNSDWSEGHVTQWFPNSSIRQEKNFAPAFAAATQGYQEASSALSRIAQTKSYSPIIRASALERLAQYNDTNAVIAIARGVKEPETLIKLGAINGASAIGPAEKWRIISPLLTDDILAVRTEAAYELVALWSNLSTEQKNAIQKPLTDYMAIQNFNNDRGFAHSNKGSVYAFQGKIKEAIASYQTSIKIEPYFSGAYINLAELYRQLQQNDNALKTLQLGLKNSPTSADIAFSLGLAYIRAKQPTKAAEYLETATKLDQVNSHYFYVLGLSLEQINAAKAYKALYGAFELSGNPQHLYALCDMQVRHKSGQAQQCINRLKQYAPENVIQQLTTALKHAKP